MGFCGDDYMKGRPVLGGVGRNQKDIIMKIQVGGCDCYFWKRAISRKDSSKPNKRNEKQVTHNLPPNNESTTLWRSDIWVYFHGVRVESIAKAQGFVPQKGVIWPLTKAAARGAERRAPIRLSHRLFTSLDSTALLKAGSSQFRCHYECWLAIHLPQRVSGVIHAGMGQFLEKKTLTAETRRRRSF